MKKISILFVSLSALALICFSCSTAPAGGDLLDASLWTISGEFQSEEGVFTLHGNDSRMILKGGKYENFVLSMELSTGRGGKGALWFHTDPSLSKGYAVAINNDRSDPQWWKMSGSLLSVRNLTKSFVKEEEWYTMSVRVEGKAVTVSINGSPVVAYTEPLQPWRTGANTKALLSKGTFAIASGSDQGEILIRKMTLEPLLPSDPAAVPAAAAVDEQNDPIIRLHQEDFPVLDYHVHLKGGLTTEDAAALSRQTGVNYAIAPNCGVGFPITDDAGVMAFLDEMRSQPFILAMQAEGREWIETFSQGVRDEFDYVFTDALTFSDNKGRRSRIWIPEETWIEDEQQYMDLIVDRICSVLQEPMQIYVNPCFLPEQMADRYDDFWTEERMNKFVDALAASGKVLEINARYKIPNKAIIQKAKAAGVKFSFGTNNGGAELGLLEYAIRMKNECGITAGDMYKPQIKI
ncbi:MAG: DUF1080 domain-containing protein [Tannerellaceae bacterium]|jgi:hypothetical protein|nr:DUF1080 domain-containing protein [Tannerellaceae bacterium]